MSRATGLSQGRLILVGTVLLLFVAPAISTATSQNVLVGFHLYPSDMTTGSQRYGGEAALLDSQPKFIIFSTSSPYDLISAAFEDPVVRYAMFNQSIFFSDPNGPPQADPNLGGAKLAVGFQVFPPDLNQGSTRYGGTVTQTNRHLRHAAFQAADPDGFQALAASDPNVRYVESNLGNHTPTYTPSDLKYSEQYGPAQLRLPAAWDTTLGTKTVAVCITDTGTRPTHEDLKGNWLGGYDFVADDVDPWDQHELGHGTHVAGIAAARLDNGLGIAGTANVGFFGARVLGPGSSTIGTAGGVQWCADVGAYAINMSWRGNENELEKDAFEYATQKGVLLVGATGNSAPPCNDCVVFPGKDPRVIAVAATDSSEGRYVKSQGGPETELAAPGDGILSSINSGNSNYGTLEGTSQAAPAVTGIASLLFSIDPALTACQVRELLSTTARDPLGDPNPGRDAIFGFGIPDAEAAVQRVVAGQVPSASCFGEAPVCRVIAPPPGKELKGIEGVEVAAYSVASSVQNVELYADGVFVGTMNGPTAGNRYSLQLATSVLPERMVRIEAKCRDVDHRERIAHRYYLVNNLPNPSVAIKLPLDNQLVPGVAPLVAEATSNVAAPLSVFSRLNRGEWHEVTGTEVAGLYVDLVEGLEEQSQSIIWVRAEDAGGVSFDCVLINIITSTILHPDPEFETRCDAAPNLLPGPQD